jgi:hypothetical protein
MSDDNIKAAVGMSRKWNAREAGREVVIDTLDKLGKNVKPDFLLLFSTIHYEKYGGFQEFLKGIWDVLPKGTPLIGGTVAGFINSQGCYTRGAVALAINYPNIDIAIGVGRNTRRNPKRAAYQCASSILTKQSKKYKTKILIDIIPGPTRPRFMGFGSHWVIMDKKMEILGPFFIDKCREYWQKGQGLEDQVIENLAEYLDDYLIFGGSSSDNNYLLTNYQFVNERVEKYSLVSMGITSDFNIHLSHTDGLKSTGKTFKVTKVKQDGKILSELNDKPATDIFFGSIGLERKYLDDRLLRTTFFYPLGFRAKDGSLCPNAIGAVIGGSIGLNYRVKSNEIELLTTSGRDMINTINEAIQKVNVKNPELGFMISCLAQLESLGANIFKVRDILIDYFGTKPFLLIYLSGENNRFPNKDPHHFNETSNLLVISKKT